MVPSQRRVPAPPNAEYFAVPQSLRSQHANGTRLTPSGTPSIQMASAGRGAMAEDVASGSIGNDYNRYSYNGPAVTPGNSRDGHSNYNPSQYSTQTPTSTTSMIQRARDKRASAPAAMGNTSTMPESSWDTQDPDLDDALHNLDPKRNGNRQLDSSFTLFSARGWLNALALVVILCGLIVLFAGYPIIQYTTRNTNRIAGYNIGGINATGQVPVLPNTPTLIDSTTPQSAYYRTGTDGRRYNLVFSDEFNTDGRTFYPGDDPFWEAEDLHYWPTGNLEWYDPSAITTKDGKLVLTLSQFPNHDLNFQGGMMTSWNKFCFTTGYIEVSVSMPGTPKAPGLWPAIWTMGNLGRAGYGATTEGNWPYSYDSCDVGTFPNQTNRDSRTPAAALTGGNGNPISYQPGQKLSSCTCPGSDHPGPTVQNGRGVPEIDVFETQVDVSIFRGEVSQSLQIAPYSLNYQFPLTSPATTTYDSDKTFFNDYKGGVYQQALSAVTYIDDDNYNDNNYAKYGFEWWSDPSRRGDGYVTWYSQGAKSWTATAATAAGDPTLQISQRLISEEPMYIIMNLGLSPGFQHQDWKHLVFPVKMYVDYVRVYQRDDVGPEGVTCNPDSHPTTDYINQHINAYSNANLTTWASAGYKFPRNSFYEGC